jgi:hypothetical protein
MCVLRLMDLTGNVCELFDPVTRFHRKNLIVVEQIGT